MNKKAYKEIVLKSEINYYALKEYLEGNIK